MPNANLLLAMCAHTEVRVDAGDPPPTGITSVAVCIAPTPAGCPGQIDWIDPSWSYPRRRFVRPTDTLTEHRTSLWTTSREVED